MIKPIKHIGEVADKYDAFLLDLWGVIHDGDRLYPGVADMLKELHAKGRKVIFLSNAPRRKEAVVAALDRLGIERDWYADVVSSGRAGLEWLESPAADLGKNYYFIGDVKDENVLQGVDAYRRAGRVEDADFLLNVGYLDKRCPIQRDTEEHAVLAAAQARGLTMLCLNPDLEVVKQSGERIPCAGALAADYEKLGGRVRYFGKPHPEVYERAMQLLGDVPKNKILAVGDSLITDIRGANRFGIDCALISGGILQEALKKDNIRLADVCAAEKVEPTYVAPGFGRSVHLYR